MSKYQNAINIGLREKETGKPVVVFPKKADGTDAEIEEKVKFWFYQQSCSAEEELKNLYVDVLTAQEVEALKK
jgi:hypothetical protein